MCNNINIKECAEFLKNHRELLETPIIKNFLSTNSNNYILESFINVQSKESYDILDSEFKKFYLEVRILRYLSDLIYFTSINIDKGMQKYNTRNILTIDDSEHSNSFLDLIESDSSDIHEVMLTDCSNIFDHIESLQLYKALKKLTTRQLNILEMHYINELSVYKISKILKVSPQFVYKTLKNATKKLKVQYNMAIHQNETICNLDER